MPKKTAQLDKNQTDLLQRTACTLIPKLGANQKLVHVRKSAFDYYNKETDEHFQVHITVTRDESDFLDFLQTEEMSDYGAEYTQTQLKIKP